MKYLKKFINENQEYYEEYFSNEIDYIKSCFIDFIDSGELIIEFGDHDDTISLVFTEPSMNTVNNGYDKDMSGYDNIQVFIEHNKILNSFYERIDECIEKFKLKCNTFDDPIILVKKLVKGKIEISIGW